MKTLDLWHDRGKWNGVPRLKISLSAMLQVTVTLTSGRSEGLSIPQSSKVGDLKALWPRKRLDNASQGLSLQRRAF